MVEIRNNITKETSEMIYGDRFEDDNFITSWCKSKIDYWFCGSAQDICKHMGLELEHKKAQDLINLADGNINILYYVSLLKSEEAVNWFMGFLVSELKNRNKSINNVSKIIAADYLKEFADKIVSGAVPRQFAKEVLNDIIDSEFFTSNISFEEYDKFGYTTSNYNVRKTPSHVLFDVLQKEQYKVANSNDVDLIIQKVLDNNPEQKLKLSTDQRMINWFVGQCMKELKGKASAQEIGDKIKLKENMI